MLIRRAFRAGLLASAAVATAAAASSMGSVEPSSDGGDAAASSSASAPSARRLSPAASSLRMSHAHRLLAEHEGEGGEGTIAAVTIDDFLKIIDSDVEKEFGHDEDPEAAQQRWIETAWWDYNNAVRAEERYNAGEAGMDFSDILYAYVICSKSPGSARRRKEDIYGYVVERMGDISADEDVTSELFMADYLAALETVYNRADMTCVFGKFRSSIIAVVAGADGVGVVPLNSYMKVRGGVVAEFLNLAYPNRTGDDEAGDMEDAAADASDSAHHDESSLEVLLCPRVQPGDVDRLQEKVINFMLHRTGDGSGSYVATMTPWANLTDDELESMPDRVKFWRTVFDLGIDSERGCRDYLERLVVTVMSGESEVEGQAVAVRIALTEVDANNYDADMACALGLIFSVSQLPQVCSVELTKVVETGNAYAQDIVQGTGRTKRPFWDEGLQGEGQVVAVSDSGIDVNHCYFWDRDNRMTYGDTNTNRRKIVQYDPFVDTVDEAAGHGTHVAGTIAGRMARDGVTESNGEADGVARNAKLAFIDTGKECGPGCGTLSIPPTDRLLGTGKEAGAKLHSASWGISFIRQGLTYQYDSLARNIDSYIAANWDMLMIVAAGNDGNGGKAKSLNSPGIAKNVLAVGAGLTPEDRPGINYVADFSSQGPAPDGRIGPQVVGPGQNIESSKAAPNQEGECESLTLKSGTSMATPAVAGAAALVRQYFLEGYYPSGAKSSDSNSTIDPSGTLVKAVLINSGRTMEGKTHGRGSTSSEPYDNIQGFGRVSLLDALRLQGQNAIVARIVDRVKVKDGETMPYQVVVNHTICEGKELRATLVWADPQGYSGCVKCLVNDLDLTLVNDKTGTVYYPNGRTDKDDLNNVERVVVPASALEDGQSWTAQIRAANLDRDDQQFSVAMSGCFSFEGQGDVGDSFSSSARGSAAGAWLGAAIALLNFAYFLV